MKFLKSRDKISFDPEKHEYRLNGELFVSVSSLIKLYSQPFDPTGEILARCAEKRGISKEELRKQWDYERDSACDRGHQLHKEAEYWIDHKKIDPNGIYCEVVKSISEIPFEGKLMSETVIYSEKFKIAGTVDVIEMLSPTRCNVWDFKQNKKLDFKSFFKRGQGYQYMMHPVSHLMDCNFIHYSLQLEIYSLLLEESGLKPEKKHLIYIPPKNTIAKIHECRNLRQEAESIIDHFSF